MMIEPQRLRAPYKHMYSTDLLQGVIPEHIRIYDLPLYLNVAQKSLHQFPPTYS
jgi:hypothetical protein